MLSLSAKREICVETAVGMSESRQDCLCSVSGHHLVQLNPPWRIDFPERVSIIKHAYTVGYEPSDGDGPPYPVDSDGGYGCEQIGEQHAQTERQHGEHHRHGG